jgi:hypothetical protein
MVRVGFITIAFMIPCQLAQADSQAICATIAGDYANPMVTNVDLWLTRFRGSYAACLSQHEAADDASVMTKDLKETDAAEPGDEVIKSAGAKPAAKLGKINPPEIFRVEKKVLKPKHRNRKRAVPKIPIKIQVLPARNPVNVPLPGSDAGAESWRVNCSPRFGGFNKASETFVSSAGKRVSCAWRPKNAPG